MDNLKKFFDENRIFLPDEKMDPGDERRFEERYDAFRHRIKFTSPIRRKKFSFWKVVSFPIVASLAIIIGTYLIFNYGPLKPKSNCYSEYREYYRQAEVLVSEISSLSSSLTMEEAIENDKAIEEIMYEEHPIVDILPEGLSEEEKLSMVREYTSSRLKALRDYRKYVSEYIAEKHQ